MSNRIQERGVQHPCTPHTPAICMLLSPFPFRGAGGGWHGEVKWMSQVLCLGRSRDGALGTASLGEDGPLFSLLWVQDLLDSYGLTARANSPGDPLLPFSLFLAVFPPLCLLPCPLPIDSSTSHALPFFWSQLAVPGQ